MSGGGNMYDSIAILDFGSQYSHLIVRRVRGASVSSAPPLRALQQRAQAACAHTPSSPALPPHLSELNVYCELFNCLIEAPALESIGKLKGVILSGGPFSVYEEGAPHLKVRRRRRASARSTAPARPHARARHPLPTT